MNRVLLHSRCANPFVDLEARVDEDRSDGDTDEEDLDAAFIDDAENLDGEPSLIPPVFYRHANENEEALTNFLARTLATAGSRSSIVQPQAIAHMAAGQALVFLPGEDDYPIFKVACRIGTEEIVVASLLKTANESHDLRSAFTRGSLRGSVYLECSMNLALTRLLQITPGIVHTRKGLFYKLIASNEQPNLLTMKEIRVDVGIGKWIRASKGLYKGDIGLVVGTHSWGCTILLVPRIPSPSTANVHKRKATLIKPPPRLFNPDDYPESGGHNSSSTLGRLSFECGLVVKEFDYHSISAGVQDMALATYSCFISCGHPAVVVSSLPRPQEWRFEQDEPVIICSSKEHALFKTALTDSAEVEIQGGIQRVPWNDIIKNLAVGSFVKIENGAFNGKSGWVVGITDQVATIVDSVEHGDASMDIRLNELRLSTPLHQYATPREPTPMADVIKPNRHKWCGVNVLVVNHAWHKGKPAVIKDVLLGQPTVSGIRLQLQLMTYDPAAPYQIFLVDSNDVVNARTLKNLSLDGSDSRSEPQSLPFHGPAIGGATPMPISSSETPAWNPSSATPTWAPSPSPRWEPSQPTTSRISQPPVPHAQHVLLDSRLGGLSLTVKVNGGDYSNKEVEATICCGMGGVTIRHTKYNSSILLQPAWVTPKHPSPTHDNGLLVIIKGDHCGKYARRIYHRHDDNATVIILALVTRSEKSTDVLTGQRLELTNDFLCTVKEPKTDREQNNVLMKPLRAEYR